MAATLIGHLESDQPQNLMGSSHNSSPYSCKVSWKLLENFWHNSVMDKQT